MLLALLVVSLAKAEEITRQQALQRAQQFMQERMKARPGSRGAKVELSDVKQVSGLYVVNASDNEGYVIVSNDDQTVPILGFSDSGHADPDNMPSNMRAWLQGYADQIAWLKAQQGSPAGQTAGTRGPATAATALSRSHSTAAIAPLLTTRWDQKEPYNDLLHNYNSRGKCVTGCVATAMAQVMNYHKWPMASTAEIPSYGTSSTTLPALPVTTFDWGNMLNEYLYHYNPSTGEMEPLPAPTEAQRTAVATLMKYCGYAVKMQYSSEASGAQSADVAPALKNYFNYNPETTQFVKRDNYSASRWADIIYHELANGRPVIYSGRTLSDGHEFVCDGYRYESGTDFFHINWGWGGVSDDYFVLSALNPAEQGVGGSNSTGGWRFNQGATIGIQKPTEHGTTADLTPTDIWLEVNSITPSRNPGACYEPMTFTLSVTNTAAEDFDGDIYLSLEYTYSQTLYPGFCSLKAGETGNVVITCTPDRIGTASVSPMYSPADLIYGARISRFTIEKGAFDTDRFVPIYGYDCDEGNVASQFIIPASDLKDMAHGTLNSMTFYAYTMSPISWGAAQFDVYLKEVEKTVFAAQRLDPWDDMQKVYSGRLFVDDEGKMVITFPEPFSYQGGNLLVGFRQTKAGTSNDVLWIGTLFEDDWLQVSLGGSGETARYYRYFLPKTTFNNTSATGGRIAGDANGDGKVDVADIVEIVNYLNKHPSARFNEKNADANGVGGVTTDDINAVVGIIMGK